MRWGSLRAMLAMLVAMAACTLAPPALATGFAPGSTCHASADAGEDYRSLALRPDRWLCDSSSWSIAAEREILRFDRRGMAGTPVRLSTRLTDFAAMRITVFTTDGHSASRSYSTRDVAPSTSDWLMDAELPRLSGPLDAVVVEFDAPRHRGILSRARLVDAGEADGASRSYELLVALICGILLVPLVFNFVFYRVLRERFLYWHALAVTFMLVQTLVTSGLINHFAALSVETLCLLSPLTWAGGVAAAALFSADLLEEGKLDRHHRLALRLVAPWLLFWALYYPLASGPLRATASTLYFASFIPVLALFLWVILVARSRGSRAVSFQIMAWSPMIATDLVRIGTTIWPGIAPLEVQYPQHIAIALEVIVTSIGVADRFMLIRAQRDRARAQARRFEDMAERDPLTGLLNRRAIEDRFEALYHLGFRCMAVIDLDCFKDINDRYGHAVGDQVLRATASALAPDTDTLAVRMGGEEFLLLLRGEEAGVRAERRRMAIPARVAAEVPGMDRLVTASMGLVQHDARHMLQGDFVHAYAHCDQLLYEAKNTGRNRTLRAFVRHFGTGPGRAAVA